MSFLSVPYTKPVLPRFAEVSAALEAVWRSGVVANRGDQERAFEQELTDRFEWPNVVVSSNCTMAMYLLLAASEVKGDVVVSSFTHPATIQAARLAGLRVVFADVDPSDLTIDVASAAERCTGSTVAILATHIFGYPCDVEALEELAGRRNLVLLFDAASAVGVRYKNRAIGTYGDGSAFSFHATKLLTTIEGGAAACQNAGLASRMRSLRNFGIGNDDSLADPLGTNAKANEIACAIGRLGLASIDSEIDARGAILRFYAERIGDRSDVTMLGPRSLTKPNNSMAPIRISLDHGSIDAQGIEREMRERGVEVRRYFSGRYLHREAASAQGNPNSQLAQRNVVCLPLFGSMTGPEMEHVMESLFEVLGD